MDGHASFAYDGKAAAFIGYSGAGLQGIYTNIRGQLEKVVDSSDLFDGKPPGSFSLGKQAISGRRIVLGVHFADGSEAPYRAEYPANNYYAVELSPGTRVGLDFGDLALPGALQGRVFLDGNNNLQREPQELGIAGARVFLDENGDAIHNQNEPEVLSDSTGSY
jgi:hypothetical protein